MIEEPKDKMAVTIAAVLWLVTSVGSVICLLTVRSMFLSLMARFGLIDLIPAINWIVLFIMVFFCIAVIIGGFEFHFRRYGDIRSWRMFSWAIGVEIAILLLALFV